MKPRSRAAIEKLEAETLEELQARFPEEWAAVGAALVAAAETRRPAALAAFLARTGDAGKSWRSRLQRPRATDGDLTRALPHLARARMAKLGAEQVLRAASALIATGQSPSGDADQKAGSARVRLGLWSGLLIQRLMFARRLERKPVSMAAFRWLWPLIPDRRLLMPLVQPKGIYCFYSGALVRALAALIGKRACLEVGAGDGTLTRFLAAAGVAVRGVDDQSWAHVVTYPDEIEKLDAVTALKQHRPAAVICSFPPANNLFEREIFQTPCVDLYVVVTSRHGFAAGDREAYQRQRTFTWASDPRLARLVLPPELDPDVLVFRRSGVGSTT